MRTETLILCNVSAGLGRSSRLEHMNLVLYKGEVLGVYGINGDRRALFIQLLQGLVLPEEGTIRRCYDTTLRSCSPRRCYGVTALGQMSRQSLLFENMTVWENLFVLSLHHRGKIFFNRQSILSETQKYLQKYLPGITPDMYVYQLNRVQRLLLSVLKAYLEEAQIILIDSASFPYTHEEYAIIRTLIGDITSCGVSFILISHHISTLLKLSDEVSIFCNENLVRHVRNTPEKAGFIQQAVSLLTPALPLVPKDRVQQNLVAFCLENMPLPSGKTTSILLRSGEVTVLCDPKRLSIRAVQQFLSMTHPPCRIVLNGRRLHNLNGALRRNEICFVEFTSRNNRFSSNLLLEDMFVSDNICFSLYKKLSTGPFLHSTSLQFMTREFTRWSNYPNITPYTHCASLDSHQKIALTLFKLHAAKPSVVLCKCNSQLDYGAKKQIVEAMHTLTRSYNCAVALLIPEIADIPFSADRYLITDDAGTFQEQSIYDLLNLDARMATDSTAANPFGNAGGKPV